MEKGRENIEAQVIEANSPIGDGRQRGDDDVRSLTPFGDEIRDEGDALNGFSESHFVGQNPVNTIVE